MAQTNINILKGYLDEVINQKRLDLIPKYFSEKFTEHGDPYVGMGLMYDDSSGDRIIIRSVAPGSPAEGNLHEGDEIVRARDGERSWNSFDELRMGGLWGQGVIGTPVTVWIKRGNVEKEVTLTRGMVQGMLFPYKMLETGLRSFLKEWSELHTRLVNVIEANDLVAYQLEAQGQNALYGRSAVWSEYGFVRIQDGKITDRWSSQDTIPLFRQLGFTIQAPELVKA